MRYAREQFARERSRTRTDFNHVVAGLWRQGCDDTADDIPVVQEMLAEAFTRTMRTHKGSIHRINL
jgi:hypothetical protein